MPRDPRQPGWFSCAAGAGAFRSLFLLVVDDRPLVCLGLARVAAAGLGCSVAACADFEQAAAEVDRLGATPGVLLVGLRADRSPALVLAAARRFGAPVVLALNCEQDAGLVRAALAAEADGYLLLELADRGTVCQTVAEVVGGATVVPVELQVCLPRFCGRPGALSARCLEVLRALAEGLHDEEVAERLGISVSAVRKHIRAAEWRLGAATRTALVAKVARLGLLEALPSPATAARAPERLHAC